MAGCSFNCLAVFQHLWELIRVGRTVHGTVDGKCRIPALDRFNGLFVVGSARIVYSQNSPIRRGSRGGRGELGGGEGLKPSPRASRVGHPDKPLPCNLAQTRPFKNSYT